MRQKTCITVREDKWEAYLRAFPQVPVYVENDQLIKEVRIRFPQRQIDSLNSSKPPEMQPYSRELAQAQKALPSVLFGISLTYMNFEDILALAVDNEAFRKYLSTESLWPAYFAQHGVPYTKDAASPYLRFLAGADPALLTDFVLTYIGAYGSKEDIAYTLSHVINRSGKNYLPWTRVLLRSIVAHGREDVFVDAVALVADMSAIFTRIFYLVLETRNVALADKLYAKVRKFFFKHIGIEPSQIWKHGENLLDRAMRGRDIPFIAWIATHTTLLNGEYINAAIVRKDYRFARALIPYTDFKNSEALEMDTQNVFAWLATQAREYPQVIEALWHKAIETHNNALFKRSIDLLMESKEYYSSGTTAPLSVVIGDIIYLLIVQDVPEYLRYVIDKIPNAVKEAFCNRNMSYADVKKMHQLMTQTKANAQYFYDFFMRIKQELAGKKCRNEELVSIYEFFEQV